MVEKAILMACWTMGRVRKKYLLQWRKRYSVS
jgi:hypothetical protein